MAKGLLLVLTGFALGLASAAILPSALPSGDAATSDLPEPYYTVLWENDDVRIVEHLLDAGDSEPMHSHPHMVGNFLETSSVRITESNGTVGRSRSSRRAPSARQVHGPMRYRTPATPHFIH